MDSLDQIVIGVACVIGFAVFMLVVHALNRSEPTPSQPEQVWSSRPRITIPECAHSWEHVEGDTTTGEIKRCSRCGWSRISFALGDLHPGQSTSVRFGVRVGDD